MLIRSIGLTLSLAAACLLSGVPATAQQLLRDAETEWFLHEITDPLLEAGGLNPSGVAIFLLSDRTINAFVPGRGQVIVVHAGLLLQLDSIDEVKGIMAHETGHITGAHAARFSEGFSQATGYTLLGLLLGAAAIAAGAPDAGIGLLLGGQSVGQRAFLRYRRVQESSADQAAVEFLEKAGVSGKGLISVFSQFAESELAVGASRFEYVITHPLSSRRVQLLEDRLQRQSHWNTPPDAEHQRLFERIKAKLYGFVYPPTATLAQYPLSDTSIKARYARVYAFNKALELDRALDEARVLMSLEPNNPYFHEIYGQILFENGRVDEALPPLKTAANLAPHQPLLNTLVGRALVAKDTPDTDKEAVDYLRRATALDPYDTFAWYNLGIVYTRQGEEGLARLAAAERAYITAQFAPAFHTARAAMELLEEGTPNWRRAQDIASASQWLVDDTDDLARPRPRRR
ncbi:MAG: M48 family metalloprotease [Rhodothalassiaceae bacterium]